MTEDAIERIADKVHRNGYQSLSPRERILYTIPILDAEVRINGLPDYIHNQGRRQLLDCVDDLRTIGADRTAGVVQRAIEILGDTEVGQLSDDQHYQLRLLSFDYEDTADDLGNKFAAHIESRCSPNDLEPPNTA